MALSPYGFFSTLICCRLRSISRFACRLCISEETNTRQITSAAPKSVSIKQISPLLVVCFSLNKPIQGRQRGAAPESMSIFVFGDTSRPYADLNDRGAIYVVSLNPCPNTAYFLEKSGSVLAQGQILLLHLADFFIQLRLSI